MYFIFSLFLHYFIRFFDTFRMTNSALLLQPPAFSFLLTAFYYLLPAIYFLPSAICFLPSAICFLLPNTSYCKLIVSPNRLILAAMVYREYE